MEGRGWSLDNDGAEADGDVEAEEQAVIITRMARRNS